MRPSASTRTSSAPASSASSIHPASRLVQLGGVRLLLEHQAPSATLYFHVDDLDAAYAALQQQPVTLEGEPHLIHRDTAGQFGPPGEEEWMTFLRDPAGNLVGLVERRAPR